MNTSTLVSLFLGWKISEAAFGQLFTSWQSSVGFALAWAAVFSFCAGVSEYAEQRHQNLTGNRDGRSDELRSIDLGGPFLASALLGGVFALLVFAQDVDTSGIDWEGTRQLALLLALAALGYFLYSGTEVLIRAKDTRGRVIGALVFYSGAGLSAAGGAFVYAGM